jgi:hypothetical protein
MTKTGDIAAAVLDAFLRGVPQDAFQIHEALDDLKLLVTESVEAVEAAEEDAADSRNELESELNELQCDKGNLEEALLDARDELETVQDDLDEVREKLAVVTEKYGIYSGALAAIYRQVRERAEGGEPVDPDLESLIHGAFDAANKVAGSN